MKSIETTMEITNKIIKKNYNIFVVGRYTDTSWEVIGIFDNQEEAESQCMSEWDFVGPLVLNECYGNDIVDWPDLYFPIVA